MVSVSTFRSLLSDFTPRHLHEMDRVGQWCALCRGHEGKKDGDKGEGRKLAVVSVVSSSSEKNVLCL